MLTRPNDSKPRATPRRLICCTTSFIFISAIGVVAMLSLVLFDSHLAGLRAGLINKLEGKLGYTTHHPPVKLLHSNKAEEIDTNFSREKPYGGGFAIVEESINRMKAQRKLKPVESSPLEPFQKRNGSFDIHFIHVPKCGGTSFTAVLREVACKIDGSRNNDCCTNPGFCDWFAKRRCKSIRGCTNHFPQRPWIFKDLPSVTILREPTERILSAWFYHGHSPNDDYFQVRPYFKEIREGKRPKVLFEEYVEMPEYQNIQTRMLGADSFPYKNVTITDKVFEQAVEALERIYFVGVQEEYELSVQVMLRELGVSLTTEIKNERSQQSKSKIKREKAHIKANLGLLSRLRDVNVFDLNLYYLAFFRFCTTIAVYPDLYAQMKPENRLKCENIQL